MVCWKESMEREMVHDHVTQIETTIQTTSNYLNGKC